MASAHPRLIDWTPPEVQLPNGDVTHPTDTTVKVTRDPKRGWTFTLPPEKILQVTALVHALLPGVTIPKVSAGKKPIPVSIPLAEGDPAYIVLKTVTFAAAVREKGGTAARAVSQAYDGVGRAAAKEALTIVFGADAEGKSPYEVKGSALVDLIVAQAEKHGVAGAEFAILIACVFSQLRYPLGRIKALAEQAATDAAEAKRAAASAEARASELATQLAELRALIAERATFPSSATTSSTVTEPAGNGLPAADSSDGGRSAGVESGGVVSDCTAPQGPPANPPREAGDATLGDEEIGLAEEPRG